MGRTVRYGLGGLGAVLLLAFAVGMSGDAIPSV